MEIKRISKNKKNRTCKGTNGLYNCYVLYEDIHNATREGLLDDYKFAMVDDLREMVWVTPRTTD